MRTQRRTPWGLATSLLFTSSLGCQIIAYADRNLIPDGGCDQGGAGPDASDDCGATDGGPAAAGKQGDGGEGGAAGQDTDTGGR